MSAKAIPVKLLFQQSKLGVAFSNLSGFYTMSRRFHKNNYSKICKLKSKLQKNELEYHHTEHTI